MAFEVIWSQAASSDLQQIVHFISRDNRDAAIKLAERIFRHVEAAAVMPLANRVVPERDDVTIREAILRPYRIVYMVEEHPRTIHVLRIWHAARGMPEIE